jgi:hypothetical protein
MDHGPWTRGYTQLQRLLPFSSFAIVVKILTRRALVQPINWEISPGKTKFNVYNRPWTMDHGPWTMGYTQLQRLLPFSSFAVVAKI